MRAAEGPAGRGIVVFDLDGTLIDSYGAIHESLSAVLAAFGKPPVTLEETRRMVGHGLPVLIERAAGAENVQEGVRLFRERYAVVGPRSTTLLPAADRVTAALAESGIPLVVASNKPSYFSAQLLEALAVASRFAIVTGPDRGFPAKPAPDMVLDALRTLDADASASLYVGDMQVDIETARAAGIPVAVLPTGSSSREELEAAGPDYLLGSLEEVLGLVESMALRRKMRTP